MTRMKAICRDRYGGPDVLRPEELERPEPRKGEVLVEICAVSLNLSDWELLTGSPAYARVFGLRTPRHRVLGSDVAGRVVALGEGVDGFTPGDAVFGDIFESFGGLAEFACAPAAKLTAKPVEMTFEQAAAIPQAACIALQGLRDVARVRPGQRVLVNGGGGGAGTFALQMARAFGAETIGVDSAEKLELMRSLGAVRVHDYRTVDYTETERNVDVVLDLAAHRSFAARRRVLAPRGRYVMVGGGMSALLSLLVLGTAISGFSRQKMGLLQLKINHGLDAVIEMFQAGQVLPVIDRVFALGDVPEALRYLGAGQARGKVVVRLRD